MTCRSSNRLLTTGEGKVKKDLGLMTMTAKHRFSKLTPRERDALWRISRLGRNGRSKARGRHDAARPYIGA